MYKGSCHCGAVKFELSKAPKQLVDCNCSICYRLGALWGHALIGEVTINSAENSTSQYIWGDKTLAIHTCNNCGCTTHWENLENDGEHMAVNFRMCDSDVIGQFQVKRFDGADTWKFLEDD